MLNLFAENTEETIEEIENILENSKNEESALTNVVEYCVSLIDDEIPMDIEEIIEIADTYGYDFTNLKKRIKAEL